MEFKQVEYDSMEYKQMVELRYEILRKPLGLFFTENDLAIDKDNLLIVSQYPGGGEITGCCILSPLSENTVQLRQMAVANPFQGNGIGRKLLAYTENIAREHHFALIYLHARKTAVEFYQKQGYKVQGEPFIEVGIPHLEMTKRLDN
jgi:predicted GNAT family N-acyltransferase